MPKGCGSKKGKGQVRIRSQLQLWIQLLSDGNSKIISNALGGGGVSDLTDPLDRERDFAFLEVVLSGLSADF